MTIHAFLARDVVRTAEPRTDEFEEIQVEAVPLAELSRDHRESTWRHLRDVSSALAFALALERLDGRGVAPRAGG
jgi:hypothetical protein